MKLEWVYRHQRKAFVRYSIMSNGLGLCTFDGLFHFVDLDTGENLFEYQSSDKKVLFFSQVSSDCVLISEKRGTPTLKVNPSIRESKVEELKIDLQRLDNLFYISELNSCFVSGSGANSRRLLARLNSLGQQVWVREIGDFKFRDGLLFCCENLIWFSKGSELNGFCVNIGELLRKFSLQEEGFFSAVQAQLNKIWVGFSNDRTLIVNPEDGFIEARVRFEEGLYQRVSYYDDESVLMNDNYKILPYRVNDGFVPFEIDFRSDSTLKLSDDSSLQASALRIGSKIYVGSHNCHLWCFDAQTGEIVAKWPFKDFVHCVMLAPNGFLIVQVMDGTWHAFSDYPR